MREIVDNNAKYIDIFTPGQLIGDFEIVNFYNTRKHKAICISDEGSVLMFEAKFFLNYVLPNVGKNFVAKRTD